MISIVHSIQECGMNYIISARCFIHVVSCFNVESIFDLKHF